ncbi:MAG: DUF115 domain-containing protein, partial [Ignavibacteria bacterium]|nr:DUF115 domain-containing protein [Ignavibacteria bacterium]
MGKNVVIRAINRMHREYAKSKNYIKKSIWRKSPIGKENQKELLSLKNKFQHCRCFVMGNGPSLKRCELSLLKNEITIASNAQYLIWEEMGFIPTFLTVEDNLVAEDRAIELNAIQNTSKIFPLDLSYCLKKDKHTIMINFIRDYKPFPQFSNDFSEKVFWGGTVSFLNLQLAFYLGCNPIYLIGFDHNYTVSEKSENFVITSEKDDVNHVHPNYFGKGYRWHDPNVERMERSY